MKILITGGLGMIGRAIAVRHVAAGDEVMVDDSFINPWTKASDMPEGVGVVRLRPGLEWKPDVLSIQAAIVGIGIGQSRPQLLYENNVGHIAAITELLTNNPSWRPWRIMFAGSMGPYGEGKWRCGCGWSGYLKRRETVEVHCPHCDAISRHGFGPVKMQEVHELRPVSHYAVSKMTQEAMLKVLGHTIGRPVFSLRYFSVYSDNADPCNPYTGVLSVTGAKILRATQPGADGVVWLNEDGEQRRDMVHVDDVADAHAHFVGCPVRHPQFDAVNVCTGRSYSLRYIATQMAKEMNATVLVSANGKLRDGDIKSATGYTEKAMSLGWGAKRCDIEASIKTYCAFLKGFGGSLDDWKEHQQELESKGLIK